ncbi:hypothetical protein HK097_010305 [Rhizophlyctis rosea]|uniref:Uncharacterized protein n=1 Tax=Rhizophlyctis rosea TaxID=64517 RepID=A0AAD5S9C4_9FUNG|nr:hypothetical protein HK097_010305 [Rhizophlyctis rosea]
MFDPYYSRPMPETHGKRGTQALDQFVEDVKRNRIGSLYNPDIGRRLDDMIPYLLDDPSPTDPDPFASPENINAFQDFLTELSEDLARNTPLPPSLPAPTDTTDFDFTFGATTGLGWDGTGYDGSPDGAFIPELGGNTGADVFGDFKLEAGQTPPYGSGEVEPSYGVRGGAVPRGPVQPVMTDAEIAKVLGTDLNSATHALFVTPGGATEEGRDQYYSDGAYGRAGQGAADFMPLSEYTPAHQISERIMGGDRFVEDTVWTIAANQDAPTTLARGVKQEEDVVVKVEENEVEKPKPTPTVPKATITASVAPTSTASAIPTPTPSTTIDAPPPINRGRLHSLPTSALPPHPHRPSSAPSVSSLEQSLAKLRLDYEQRSANSSPAGTGSAKNTPIASPATVRKEKEKGKREKVMLTREQVDRIRHAQVVGALLRKIKGVVGKGRRDGL